MHEAFIYDHVRTPRGRGRADGALHEITPIQLTTQVLSALRDRNELDTEQVEDVLMGCVMPIGEQGCNVARVAALQAGYAESVAGFQLNRFCASGLEAVNLAAARVMAGELDAAVAGGVESMSRVPLASDGGACYSDPQTHWQTWYIPQGIGADMIATQDGYSRIDVDSYAVESQRRAGQASAAGHFKASLTPVRDILGEVVLDKDEAIRPSTTLEDLAKLKPAFTTLGEQCGFDGVMLQRYPQTERIEHVHTGGNSSSIVDGAAAILLGNRAFGERSGLKPRARVRSFVSIGSEPAIMLTGPGAASRKALAKAGMQVSDIDLFEVNEAFASVVLRFMNEMGVPHDKVNVNGGAIALGHPLGATGAMILGSVLDELERRGLRTALITLCAAAGMATATIIERV
ncbi:MULTISPECIES: acetyl-CoA C-acetyltransferase [Pseudomonas]|uniref:acetyl-CoA C-acetyltransferase n=1 Tax=Pseudomonas nitroreducens TaxID=46680 RepID=UPI001E3416AA|nr:MULTISPECIES: acetyl-CoA C-acetyltransferase [Pseudomonas]MCE4071473.1 acetyl-CoA C-acetyltransferase [Pseudomonas nitritireducens]MCE4081249.1 acetyl-CoA C-acetyltransferase [Pseudomonas nitroreducens]